MRRFRQRIARLGGFLILAGVTCLAGPTAVTFTAAQDLSKDDFGPPVSAVVIPPPPAFDQRCVVAVLNRVAQVGPDGTWALQNVPTNFGPVRARATCVIDGATFGGESDLFTVPSNGVITVGEIRFDALEPIPQALQISAPPTPLTSAGVTVPLTVMAVYGDGSTRDVTNDLDVSYQSSNAAIASVNTAGVVTAHTSGPALITVLREGVSAFIRLTVSLSNTDSDGDGIPDDLEVTNGLDPHNPVDALEDPDHDGLTNFQELMVYGTNRLVADTDGDGITDGDEVSGKRGFVTDPVVADTDGDGIPDLVEIQTGSDPTNGQSFNLGAALQSLEVRPTAFVLTVNTIIGEASRQLSVIGHLIDGKTSIDLTSTARGTNYTSSDLAVCNFGVEPGRVFAGGNGTCTISATNSGLTAPTVGTVRTFAPTALSFVAIPGYANNVDVNGNFAYVAAGAAGLQVVGVADHAQPMIVGAIDTPGNADDVKVSGTVAYVADGASGLRLLDVSNPTTPRNLGFFDTPGEAQGVVVRGNLAYVADGASGLQIIDVGNAASPSLVGSVDTPGTAKGVDVQGTLAVIADDSAGIQVVDVTDSVHPRIIGSSPGGQAKDVVLRDNFVYVADFTRSLTTIDVSAPASPIVRASTPSATGGLLNDVALSGRFALGADVLFVNGVPIVDVQTPASPIPRAILDFRNFRDDNGMGIAVDGSFVYLTATQGSISDNGTTGDTRLYIGQYLALEDTAGIPPTVRVVSPHPGDELLEGQTIILSVDATDDVAVASVSLLVNGTVVFTDTSAPYETSFTVPTGVSSLTFGATAIDLASNIGRASDVVVSVMPDPLTTVTGRVIDQAGSPVAGGAVTCLNFGVVSGSDGGFSLPNVPTVRGDIFCTAIFMSGGMTVRAVSARVPAVRSGTTNVGSLRPVELLDTWHLNAGIGEVVTLGMTRIPNQPDGSSTLDPILELRDSRGFLLAADDDSGSAAPPGPGRNAVISNVSLPATDTYAVLARGAGGTSGPYVLDITPSTIALLPGPPIVMAPAPPPEFRFTGVIARPGERDAFVFAANVGQRATIEVRRMANNADGTATLDPAVELRDSRGFFVASDSDTGLNDPQGPGRNALVPNLLLNATDAYRVIVAGEGGTTGPYDVRIKLVTP